MREQPPLRAPSCADGGHRLICREAVCYSQRERHAQRAGARIVCPAKTFRWGGYAGWFADPDGHLWEIVFNPRPFMD